VPQLVLAVHWQVIEVALQVLPLEHCDAAVQSPEHSPVLASQRCAPQTAPGLTEQCG
jgi:hypothetical protein